MWNERKKENSSAEARTFRPIVRGDRGIERDVPGNTAERIWHAPIQTRLSQPYLPYARRECGRASRGGGFGFGVHRVNHPMAIPR